MVLCTAWCAEADIAARPNMTGVTTQQMTDAAVAASELLWALSGKQFNGQCQGYVRPVSMPVSYDLRTWVEFLTTMGYLGGYSTSWGTCLARAGDWAAHERCSWSRQIDLGTYPIRTVTQVKVDGAILPTSAYRVDDWRFLVRTDGGSWPVCQDLMLDDTQQGTFSVTYTYGQDPPAAGKQAAITLGCEMAKAWAGLTTRLPSRVTSLTRQQVTMAILDPMQFLQREGMPLTGIYEVDLFIRTYNPAGQRSKPLIWSPDRRRNRTTGTTYNPGSQI